MASAPASGDSIMEALENALTYAERGANERQQIAEALKPHMDSLMGLATQGRLTETQVAQLRVLKSIADGDGAQQPATQQGGGVQSGGAAAAAQGAQQVAGGQQGRQPTNGWSNSTARAQQTPYGEGSASATPNGTKQYPSTSRQQGRPPAGYANGASQGYQRANGGGQESDEKEHLRISIQRMAYELDPEAVLDKDVEDLLIDAVFDFVQSTTEFSSRLARHRNSDTLGTRDLQLYLERHLGIRIPGFASDESRLPHSDLPPPPPVRNAKGRKG